MAKVAVNLLPKPRFEHSARPPRDAVRSDSELGFDSAPFDPDDHNSEVVLIISRRFLATFPITAGSAGLERESGQWVLKWVWLHPYERGTTLFDESWSALERQYGSFLVEGPYSPAMGAFLRRCGIPEPRFEPQQLE